MSHLKRPTCFVVFSGLLLIIVSFASPADLLARAGGGGGFSGGGGFGGGGGFSGGGGFGGGFGGGGFHVGRGRGGGGDLPPSAVAVIVIVVVAYIVFKLYIDYSNAASGSQASTGFTRYHNPVARRKIQQLTRTDTSFDLVAFLEHFQSAFLKIQQTWSAQDLSEAKHFMSDRVLERFSLQLQEQRDLGYRNVIDQIQISQCTLVDIDTNSMFDVLTVCVTASAVDYRVALSDGSHVSGNKRSSQSFTEFWTLLRRHGTQSVASGRSLLQGHCPNCGAEIHLNRLGNCESCDSIIRSGEYDWVLSEITQAGVWKPPGPDEIELANEYRNTADPGFSIHHVTDRASVMFWRKAMADRLGEIAPLAKIATDEFCEAHAPKLKLHPDGRTYQGNCSVGSLSIAGVVRDDDADRALLHVHFSAHEFHQAQDGTVSDKGNWKRYRNLMVLRRNKGVTSNVSRSLNSANCPSCGAPETDVVSHSCEFCGEVINQGGFDWVLEQLLPWSSSETRYWRERLSDLTATQRAVGARVANEYAIGTDPNVNSLDELAWTIKVLTADGKIHDRERSQLLELARRNSISPPVIESMLVDARSSEIDAPEPPNLETARRWLGDMAEMALVDGEISQEEKHILAELGRGSGLAAADINLVIAKRRALARKQIRMQKVTPD